MARLGVSYEQVAAAADALVGAGQQPTIRSVRERLGDTGSPNTIHRHLSDWREARPVAPAAAPELPPALTAAFAQELSRAAAAVRGEIESRLVQAQAEAAELAAAGEALEAERDELLERVAALTRERDRQSGVLAQQAAEGARIEVASARLRVEAQAERVKDQAAEIARLGAALEAAHDGRIAAERDAAVLTARLEAAADRQQRAEDRAKEAAQEAARAVQAADAARAAAEQAMRQAQAERDDARSAAADARERAALLEGRLKAREDAAQEALAT